MPVGRRATRSRGTALARAAQSRVGRRSEIPHDAGDDQIQDSIAVHGDIGEGSKPENPGNAATAVVASTGTTSEGSIYPAESTSQPTNDQNRPASASRARGAGSNGAARAGSLLGRLRPKNIRRDVAEREQIAVEESKKQQRRLADDARIQARVRAGLRGRSRGRGPFLGNRGGFITHTVNSAGISFESPTTAASSKTSARQTGTVAKVASAASTSQGEGSLQRGSQASGSNHGHSSVAPYRDERARVNTDLLDSLTQEFYIETTTGSSGGSGKRKKQLMPMGLLRHDHQALDSRVSAEKAERDATEGTQMRAESEESDLYMDDPDKLHINDVGMQNDTKVWGDAPRRRKSVRIKTEDAHTSSPADLRSIPPAAAEPTVLPHARKRHVKQADQPFIPGSSVEHFDDLEDKFVAADLDKMRKGLGRVAIGGFVGEHSLDNKLFLFQFPPILPPLRRKDDEHDAEADRDNLVTSSATRTKATSGAADLPADDSVPIKIESSDTDPPSVTATALRDLIGDGGYVGQLKVRQSGKVELSWGGRILEMMPGDDQLSLITAVITEQQSEHAGPFQGETAGKAYGMGRIEGKFVLAPALDDEEEWTVDLNDVHLD